MASGLTMNREKSDIYFNGMKTSDMDDILMVSGFRKGTFPIRYLGIPISAKKLSVMDGRKLIDKVTARIRSWGASHLSYSSRLVLTQSVLTNLHSYWMTVFLLPSGIIKKIESICRNYLWYGTDSYHHAPNVSWDDCCYPKEVGGLGLRCSKDWNKALLGKYIWWIEKKQDHLWVKWINHVYMKGVHWTEYVPPLDCAWSWRKIAHCMLTFRTGTSTPISVDKFSVMDTYQWLREVKQKVPWRFVCWNTLNIPRCSFIFWEYKLGRLFTYDRLKKMGYNGDDKCLFCNVDLETHKHVFHDCVFAQRYWSELQRCLGVTFWPDRIEQWCCRGATVSKLVRNIVAACVVAVIYNIWILRNKARVKNVVTHPKWVITKTIDDVLTRFRVRNKSMLSLYDRTWLSKL